jgi:hypothetical protein
VEIREDYRRERWRGEITGYTNDADALGVQAGFPWRYGAIELKLEPIS